MEKYLVEYKDVNGKVIEENVVEFSNENKANEYARDTLKGEIIPVKLEKQIVVLNTSHVAKIVLTKFQ